jgi:hypothetical protein
MVWLAVCCDFGLEVCVMATIRKMFKYRWHAEGLYAMLVALLLG